MLLKWWENKKFNYIMAVIVDADDQQINQIIRAVLRRYEDRYPDEEMLFLALPKNDLSERRRIVESLVDAVNQPTPLQ